MGNVDAPLARCAGVSFVCPTSWRLIHGVGVLLECSFLSASIHALWFVGHLRLCLHSRSTPSKVSNLSPPVIEVQDVDFKYDTGPMILKNVNFGLDQTSRICIVGPNGAGENTPTILIWEKVLIDFEVKVGDKTCAQGKRGSNLSDYFLTYKGAPMNNEVWMRYDDCKH